MQGLADYGRSKFTFQYGATSTTVKLPVIVPPAKFTFQYGATSTKCKNTKEEFKKIFTFQYGATSTLVDVGDILDIA